MLLGYIQLVVEIACCLIAILLYKDLQRRHWVWWIPFLVYTCVVELWGTWLEERKELNLWLYNPYIIISTAFYLWFLLYISILREKSRRLLYRVLFTLAIINLGWYLVWGNPRELISYHLNAGALLICICCLLFYYTQVKSPAGHRSLTAVPAFWIVSGLLFFYTGISIYTSMYNFLAMADIRVFGVTIQNLIPQVLSLLLYSSIITSFIQCRYPLKSL